MKIPVPPLGADATRGDDFEVFSAPSLVRFLSRGVQPPSQIYLKHTDVLQVQCASSLVGESVTFNYRLLRADSALIKGQFAIQVPSTRAVVTQSEPMAEGFLLSLSCKAASAVTRGATFARAFLTAGSFGPGQPSYLLMADYVTTQFAPAHPNGRIVSAVEGPGRIRALVGSAPAAGSAAQLSVPTNARWNVKLADASITTSAAVGNRIPFAQVSIGGTNTLMGTAEAAVAASTTVEIVGTPLRNVPFSPGTQVWVPFQSNLVLLGGDVVFISAFSLNPADQISGITVAVEEWLDNV